VNSKLFNLNQFHYEWWSLGNKVARPLFWQLPIELDKLKNPMYAELSRLKRFKK
jgi:hypothetical protein